MIIVFRNETHNVKLIYDSSSFACSTWMCCKPGEGEEEVESHGRSRVKVSSQETDLKGQWSLRMRTNEAEQKKAVRQEIVKQFSTGCTTKTTLTQLPTFLPYALVLKSRSPSLLVGGVALLRSSPRASDLIDFKPSWFFRLGGF